jgi:hypothetical protein
LQDPQQVDPEFNPSTWFTSSVAPVDCGAPVVKFYRADPSRGTNSIDSIFSADVSGAEPFDFKTGPASDPNLAGDSEMYWKVCLEDAPTVCTTSPQTFTYSVIDACDPPAGFTAPTVNAPTLVA